MSKELILKMCKEIVNGKDFDEEGFGCAGFECSECPFERREEDGNLGCHDRTVEATVKIAKKYIAENTEFDWEEFKSGSIAVLLDTKEKIDDFLKECDKQNVRWGTAKASERMPISREGISENCYCCYCMYSVLEYCHKAWYESEGKTIVKWQIKGDKNMFKVGDRVKRINNRTFSNGDYVVTVKEIIKNRVWFKETNTSLNYKEVELAEETTKKPNTELTFKEFVNEAEEGKIFVSRMGVEFYKEYKNIKIKLPDGVKTNKLSIPVDSILRLKKQEYTFTEAIEKAREGNTITSLVSEEFYSPVEVKSGKAIFELKEIEGKWSVED